MTGRWQCLRNLEICITFRQKVKFSYKPLLPFFSYINLTIINSILQYFTSHCWNKKSAAVMRQKSEGGFYQTFNTLGNFLQHVILVQKLLILPNSTLKTGLGICLLYFLVAVIQPSKFENYVFHQNSRNLYHQKMNMQETSSVLRE